MNAKHLIMVIVWLCFNGFQIGNVKAQKKQTTITKNIKALEGLTKLEESKFGDRQIMLDGETFPVLDPSGKRVRGMKMMQSLMSGEYTPDFYVDSSGEIKAGLLRKTTSAEKVKIKRMQANRPRPNNSALKGKAAKAFSVEDIHGKTFTLEALKGKIVVLNFWFIQCKPCVMEIPELNKLVKKYEEKNVVFLGLANNGKDQLISFLKKEKFAYNIIPKSTKLAVDYGVSGYPTHIVIAPNGKIEYADSGYGPGTVENIENTIESLLKK